MKQKSLKKLIVVSPVLLSIAVAFQNCSEVEFATQQTSALEQCVDGEGVDCGEHTNITLRTIKPAVAVRGISCLMCHADIRANVITDFGYGSDWFFGGPSATINSVSWYNNYVNTWQTASGVVGQVFVPDATIPAGIQNSLGPAAAGQPPLSIAELMEMPYAAPGAWGQATAVEREAAMAHRVTPPSGAKIVAKQRIVIQAPTEADIAALSPALFDSPESSGAVRIRSMEPLQIIEVAGTGGTYMANDEASELQCANKDIVVKGPLLLRNLRVNAQGGCRLYVSGTVFIEGAVVYGPGDKQNLQITSANGISMGLSVAGLRHRLGDSRGLQITGARPYADRANQTLNEARIIGGLKDAKDDFSPRLSVNFEGLLLNAPMIQSRYLGVVKGSIIAEAAIFALGDFNFQFDPVFTRVNAFPLLKKPILGVQ